MRRIIDDAPFMCTSAGLHGRNERQDVTRQPIPYSPPHHQPAYPRLHIHAMHLSACMSSTRCTCCCHVGGSDMSADVDYC